MFWPVWIVAKFVRRWGGGGGQLYNINIICGQLKLNFWLLFRYICPRLLTNCCPFRTIYHRFLRISTIFWAILRGISFVSDHFYAFCGVFNQFWKFGVGLCSFSRFFRPFFSICALILPWFRRQMSFCYWPPHFSPYSFQFVSYKCIQTT